MKTYLVKLMNNDKIVITVLEFENLKISKNNLVYIPSADEMINTSSITRIVDTDKAIQEEAGSEDVSLYTVLGNKVERWCGQFIRSDGKELQDSEKKELYTELEYKILKSTSSLFSKMLG